MILFTNKPRANQFDPVGVVFEGFTPKRVYEMKLVGYIFDPTLSWGPMIAAVAKKARVRLGAIYRLHRHLSNNNLQTMYIAFVRSVLEYGNAMYMSACPSHLAKLDKIQLAAERMGSFKLESLASRREVAALNLSFKLLDGTQKGSLHEFKPTLNMDTVPGAVVALSASSAIKRRDATGVQVMPFYRDYKRHMLGSYKRSYFGALPGIWEKIPQEIIKLGASKGWQRIKSKCKSVLTSQ